MFIYSWDFFIRLVGGRYSQYVDEVSGANITFWIMLFYSAVFILFRKKLVELDNRNELLILIFIIGTMLQFLGFSNAFAKRVGQYFLVSQCMLLPQLTCFFCKKSRKILWWIIVLFQMFLFIMQFAVLGQSHIVPYSFII